MQPHHVRAICCWVLGACCIAPSTPLLGQQKTPSAARILSTINDGQRVLLRGGVDPLAQPQYDQGSAPVALPLNRILLVLRRSPQQEADLQQLLQAQQRRGDAQFHQWLTPAAFGARFGVDAADQATVAAWLRSHGFSLGADSPGGNVIEFSGTPAQVATAFGTSIHRYHVNGKDYYANATAPSLPAALTPVVAGPLSLDNFPKRASPQPNYNVPDGGGTAIAPSDFAIIYNLLPLYNAGINGAGESIAIVGRSDVAPTAISGFRQMFLPGAPANPPQIIVNGADPGIGPQNEETEAELDVEWTGAIAPDATIKFVVSESTDVTDGADLSAQYIVDHDLAPVMSSSFGECEATLGGPGSSGNLFYQNLYEQAAAEGTTVVVAAGDSGSAGCDPDDADAATQGLAVNGITSTPYNLAVGGTEFDSEAGNWSATNAPGTLASALGYIPEQAWNESCSAALCGQGDLAAGGGGASAVYAKPAWQMGPGVPSDGARDIPDVSLAAAARNSYVICTGGPCASSSPLLPPIENFAAGTSVAAQAFAGIMALVDQKTGSAQGLANPTLYQLAAQQSIDACNASMSPASNCIFNDVTAADNDVPCTAGTPDCSASTGTLETPEGATAYPAGPGYDLATGWGSVNVANLVNAWPNAAPAATQTTLALSATQLVHGATPTATVTVAVGGVAGNASGNVVVMANTGGTAEALVVGSGTLAQGSATLTLNDLPGGNYPLVAQFVGDDAFAPSDSPPVNVTVSPEASVVTMGTSEEENDLAWHPITIAAYGSPLAAHALIAGVSGVGAIDGTVAFQLDGAAIAGGTAPVNGEGQAAIVAPLSNLSIGTHTLAGTYSGGSGLAPSTSPPLSIQVTAAASQTTIPIVIVTPNSDGSQNLFLRAYASSFSVTTPDTTIQGTVDFSDGNGNALGSTPVSGGYDGNLGGFAIATGTLSATLPAGPASVTAHFSGDANFNPSDSAPFAIDGGAFHFVASPSQLVVPDTANATAATQISVILDHPLADSELALSCIFLTAGNIATCSVSPATVTLTPDSGPVLATLAINTGTVQSHFPLRPAPAVPPILPFLFNLAALAAALLLLLCFRNFRRKHHRVRILIPLAWALLALACGGPPAQTPESGIPLTGGSVLLTGTAGIDTNSLSVTVAVTR